MALYFVTDDPGGLNRDLFVRADDACLDSRNVAREGRNPRAFHGPYTRKKIARYLLDTQGRSREYWNAWCEDVAQAYDLTPFAVSALHMAIVPSENVPF